MHGDRDSEKARASIYVEPEYDEYHYYDQGESCPVVDESYKAFLRRQLSDGDVGTEKLINQNVNVAEQDPPTDTPPSERQVNDNGKSDVDKGEKEDIGTEDDDPDTKSAENSVDLPVSKATMTMLENDEESKEDKFFVGQSESRQSASSDCQSICFCLARP
jgi:hypothetical protein